MLNTLNLTNGDANVLGDLLMWHTERQRPSDVALLPGGYLLRHGNELPILILEG